MAENRQAFVQWVEERCDDAERLLRDDLAEGPRYYFSKGSSQYAVEFFERVERWRSWVSGLITGLHHRVNQASHLVTDAQCRFDESHLLVFRIADQNDLSVTKTFDLRAQQATFTHGDGWLELRRWFEHGREDPTWQALLETLRRNVQSFRKMLLGQAGELPLRTLEEQADPNLSSASSNSKYQCLSRLGEGLYGEVWSFRDSELKRDVAVKFIRSTGATRADVIEHARALTRVVHPSVVTVYEVTQITDPLTGAVTDAIVMELVPDSEPLESRLKRTLLRLEVERIGKTLLDGIAAYHAKGLAHTDLHARNVLINGHIVKIIDPIYFHTAIMGSTATREAQQAKDLRNLHDLLRQTLEAGDVSLDLIAHFLRETKQLSLDGLSHAFQEALDTPKVASSSQNPTAGIAPDIRVVVSPGIVQTGSSLSDLMIIEVQNHSPNPFFLSAINLKTADGQFGMFMNDDATGAPNSPATIMPGDSHSLRLSVDRLRHANARFVSAVATDKIGRRFESNVEAFAKVLATLRLR